MYDHRNYYVDDHRKSCDNQSSQQGITHMAQFRNAVAARIHAERFAVVKQYTWKRNVGPFNTATVFKGDKEHSVMSAADANAFCEKWNGRRGDFEQK